MLENRRSGYERIPSMETVNCGRFCSAALNNDQDHDICEASRNIAPSDMTSSDPDSSPQAEITRLTTESGESPDLRQSSQCSCPHVNSTIYCVGPMCSPSQATNNNHSDHSSPEHTGTSTDPFEMSNFATPRTPLHSSTLSNTTDTAPSTSNAGTRPRPKRTPYPRDAGNNKKRREH